MNDYRVAEPIAPANQICARCGHAIYIAKRHRRSHDGVGICLTPPANGVHNPNPIFYDGEKWNFWDETWSCHHGPFDDYVTAEKRLRDYVHFLDTGELQFYDL